MNKIIRSLHFIFLILSFTGRVIIERPNRVAYFLLIALSVVSHLTAVLIVVAVLCYAYMGRLYAVR